MSDVYAVEDRMTKMCLEMVNSLTSAKDDMDKMNLTKEYNLDHIQLMLGFQSVVKSVGALMRLIEKELQNDINALLLPDEN